MADSDSDASSTASHSALVSRPASAVKTDPVRYQRCYPRSLLLQLSKSNKIRPPQGLKPLTEWYGEYELPSLHPVNSSTNAGPNGRYSGRDGQTGGRRERERGERGATTAGAQSERYNNERDTHARPAVAGAPATGQMGDFKLAGQRPFTLPKDSDSGDALTGGSRRRQNPRDLELRDRDLEGKDRNWAAAGLNSADRRRQLGGEFVKKDGRAAEEGGWRSSRETMQLGRERQPRDRLDRPGFGDRDSRSGQLSSGDRRRQPAWMDEEEPSSSSRRDGSSGTYQRRNQNGFQSNDGQPAWMADEPASTKGRFDDSLEALESRSSAKQQSSESHVDSIQAFKAQMKEMERRQKIQEQKELRKEMGLPDLPDEAYTKKTDDSTASSAKPQSAQDSQPAAVKSVFADFLLPSSTSKEKELSKVAEEKPRSSRFARMFAADAAAAQTGDRGSPANGTQSPAHNASTAPQMAQSSSSNNLLAALLPGAAKSPMQAPPRPDGASPNPQTMQTDNQSMARLMEMLHMSSAAPTGVQPPSMPAESKPPGVPSHVPQATPNGQPSSKQQARSRTQPVVEGALPTQQRNDLRSPEYRQDEYNSHQQQPPRSGSQQVVPNMTQSSQQNREQVTSSQSRLANRTSGYGLNDPAIQQQARRQEPLHAPVPPQQPNVNLLQLLAGQISPPPGPLPSHLNNLPPPSHQQNPQRGQPMQSPPPHGPGPFPPMGTGGMNDHQHAAQMASFLQGQTGSAGRPLPPPGMQGAGNMQFGRPPSQAPFMPPQGAFPPQQGPFQPSHQQQQQHPGHLRSPSGHMNALLMQQQQQQRSPSNGHPQQSTANHPLPPPQAFAQQNALAQLLAQGGHPGQGYGGMRSPPAGPPGYPPQTSMPPPQMHMHQHQNQAMHVHASPPPAQQNQIDLMALLTGGASGAGFAGR